MIGPRIILLILLCLGGALPALAQTAASEWTPYQFGKSVATNEVGSASPSFAEDEVGLRYWVSSADIKYQVAKPQISSLDYKVDNSEAGEMFFYLTSRNARYLFKGVIGLGGEQKGNVDDSDYNSDGSKGSDTNSVIGQGRLFYAYADLGYKLKFLSTSSARTSLLGGVEYIQDVMTARGITCKQTATGTYAGECNAGDTVEGVGVKSLQNEGEWSAFRLGLENNYHPIKRLNWHNEAVFIPYAYFRNNDFHYLRSDLGPDQPNIVDNGDYSYGVQLESSVDFIILPSWSVNAGARFWEIWTPQSTTKVGNPVQGTENSYSWNYQRLGLFIGTGYHF